MSNVICKHMYMRNSAILNANHITVKCRSRKRPVQALEVLMEAILHLWFDHSTEYDPEEVFDKNSAFCSKFSFFMKPTYIQVLIKKECLKLE